MPWCNHCQEVCPTVRDEDRGYICCEGCGRVLDQDIFVSGITFEKTSSGQSRMAGAFVKSVLSEYSLSHERTLMKGRDEISNIVGNLSIRGGESIIDQAHAFYKIAVERNFTRGRKTSHVAAACLYIACRQNMKPYLLIDFSDYLQINVYVLGAVFLLLCQLLRLEEHPIVQKPVDPSLFIHRFAERLLGERNTEVIKTALRIIASMKRDWMQTGRKPSGLCGAALYISALSQGLKYSKSDIVNVVHVCEATLTKRLIEFENTESGSLTIEEFLTKADELKGESRSVQPPSLMAKTCVISELLCEHKDHGVEHFAHGLCRDCYEQFIEISGGLQGGAEPPAFQHAERQRMEKIVAEEKAVESSFDTMPCERETCFKTDEKYLASKEPGVSGASTGQRTVEESTCDRSQEHEDICVEPESLSDIDDVEVDGYLHNEEEKHFKKIIWEKMNKEYLEEQAAKEAAAAAAKEAYDATFANCSEDVLSAQELAAAAAAAVAKSRKERKQKRAEEAKNSTPAQTAAEATRRMLKRKTFSSKINYEALNKLYTSEQENVKEQPVETDIGDDADEQHVGKKIDGKTFDSEVMDDQNNDYAQADTFEDDYAGGEYDDGYNYGNEDEYEFDFY